MSETRALQLVDEIVSVQGVIFLRELLRTLKQSGVRITLGTRKSDTLEHIRDAIRAGFLGYDDLIEWLHGIEGWGQQHTYLYKVSAKLAESPFMKPPFPDRWNDYVRSKGIPIANERLQVLQFPDRFRLGRVAFDGKELELVWRKGHDEWRRDVDKDEERIIDDDQYRFEAWRLTPERSVMRFVCLPELHRAALFVQVPLGEEHREAKSVALETIGQLFPASWLRDVDVSHCLSALDQSGHHADGSRLAHERGRIRPQATAFGAFGASVRFLSHELPSYASVPAVRHVRNALRVSDFRGEHGMFSVELESGPGLRRSVKMSMSGDDNRLYFFAKMSSEEVWAILNHICGFAP
jgi:hypothetical protein